MNLLFKFQNISENDFFQIREKIKSTVKYPAAIILSGPVGAGKTTFTKYFVDDGQKKHILSPTYSLINEAGKIAHADFYRIKQSEELIHLEIELYAEGKDFFLIEWGKPFVPEITRQLNDFFFYELVFATGDSENTRDLSFYQL